MINKWKFPIRKRDKDFPLKNPQIPIPNNMLINSSNPCYL